METNFISAIEIMISSSMDFLKFNTETGQAGGTEIWDLSEGFLIWFS